LTAHPWRDPLRVSQQLADAFPEIGDETLQPATADPRNRVSMRMRGARSAPVAALVLIERGASFALQAEPPLSALAALIRQSPWVILGDSYARPHLDLLRHAAAQPVFRLRHTRAELHSLATVLLGALA
jgi:hypothetical protein